MDHLCGPNDESEFGVCGDKPCGDDELDNLPIPGIKELIMNILMLSTPSIERTVATRQLYPVHANNWEFEFSVRMRFSPIRVGMLFLRTLIKH